MRSHKQHVVFVSALVVSALVVSTIVRRRRKSRYHNKEDPEESTDMCRKIMIILGELWTA